MDQHLIEAILLWLPTVLGALIVIYGMSVMRLITPVSSERAAQSSPRTIYGLALGIGAAAVPVCGLAIRAEPDRWWIGIAWLWGTLVALAILALTLRTGSQGSVAGMEAPPMLLTGGFMGGLAFGLLAVALPWAIAHARSSHILAACAGGLCLPLLLHHSIAPSPTGMKASPVTFSRDATGVFAFLLIASLFIGQQRYEGNLQGSTFPLAVAAVILCVGLLLPWVLLRKPRPVLSLLLFTLITSGIEAFAVRRLFNDWTPLICLSLGHITGFLLLMAILAFSGRTIYGNALSAAVLAGGSALSFRFMGAYGVALAGIGLLPLLLVVFAHTSLRESSGSLVLRSAAAWTAIVFFRILLEEMNLTRSINLSEPYPSFGIIAGVLFPFLLASFAHPPVLSRLLTAGLLGVLLPVLLGLFWKIEGTGGFMLGLALAQFLILFFSGEGASFSQEIASFLVWPLSLSTLRLAPLTAAYSVEMTRSQRSWGLLIFAGILIFGFFLFSLIFRRRS